MKNLSHISVIDGNQTILFDSKTNDFRLKSKDRFFF